MYSDNSWGDIIEQTLNFGREDRSTKYKKTKLNESNYEKFTHSSHVMIYSKTDAVTLLNFPIKAVLLMQMRFDGYIGFPGGLVEKNETPLQAICREVKEELGWWEKNGAISDTDYQFSHVDEEKEAVFHFYATEVSEAKMREIESSMLKASSFGSKVLGHFRIPLYIMGDAFRGFPSFLRNHFVDNTKLQLIETVVNLNFFTEEQIVQALHSAPIITY